MRTFISGQIIGIPEIDKAKFERAAESLMESNHTPVSPFSISPDGHISLPARIEILSGCDAIYLLPDWLHSRDAMFEKYYCEMSGKDIIFQSFVEENARRECDERLMISKITGAIESVTNKKLDQYKEENRKPELFYPRIIFSHQCKINGLSEEKIAYYLDRDVTTIIHQLKKYKDNFGFVKDFRMLAEKVNNILNPVKS